MQIKRSLLWLYTGLLAVGCTALVLAAGMLTKDTTTILLPWVLGPVLGVFTARLWFTHGMLPDPLSRPAPSPLLPKDAFALSGTHFFPVGDNCPQETPTPPKRERFVRARRIAVVSLVLSWAGCLVPFFCIPASLLALIPTVILLDGHGGAPWKHLPCTVRRRSLLSLCLILAGMWSSVLVILLSVSLTS